MASMNVLVRSFCSNLKQFEPYFLNKKPLDWTSVLEKCLVEQKTVTPAFRLLNPNGELVNESVIEIDDQLRDESVLKKMYRTMLTVNIVDKILYDSQRQGRISFYLTNSGEEAAQVGSAAALHQNDLIYAQYRELGALLWRNFGLNAVMDQCYGTCDDKGKGKQMPVHYGSKECNFVTISSPLGTQVPQAVGAAYVYKQIDNRQENVVIVYFGEGAASEGDVHAAMNFAATLQCPVVFFCRNNGYAISTPATEQYASDGIVARALAYGMPGIRVDGNDLFAVYTATKYARNYCAKNGKPILIEAMTYRLGHHSTSDDSSAYRTKDEIDYWQTNFDPIKRMQLYLQAKNMIDSKTDSDWRQEIRKDILRAFKESESKSKPHWSEMFTDVYHELPDHLKIQHNQLKEHLEKYANEYPLENYKNSN